MSVAVASRSPALNAAHVSSPNAPRVPIPPGTLPLRGANIGARVTFYVGIVTVGVEVARGGHFHRDHDVAGCGFMSSRSEYTMRGSDWGTPFGAFLHYLIRFSTRSHGIHAKLPLTISLLYLPLSLRILTLHSFELQNFENRLFISSPFILLGPKWTLQTDGPWRGGNVP